MAEPREATSPQETFQDALDDLRQAVRTLGYLGSADQANAVLMLKEDLFDRLAEAARVVIRS